MRSWMIKIVLVMLPILAGGAFAWQSRSTEGSWESWGFSSDESGGSSYLGVDTRDVTTDRLSALNLKEEKGVEITMVDQDAPAGKAGLKEHDVIMKLNGSDVESVEQLRRMIRETPPGRVVTLGLSRHGQPMTVKVQLADRKKTFSYSTTPQQFKFAMPALPSLPDMDLPVSVVVVHSSSRSGLMVENLSPQLGDFFGAKNGQGVLVRSVEKGTAAEKAGFRAGDVIVKVNGQSVSDTGDFSHAMHGRKNAAVTVDVIRDKREQTLTLTLPDHGQSRMLDESLTEVPDLDAETRMEISEAQDEIAKAKPELEEAARESAREASREAREQQRELQEQMREMQREMREDMRYQVPGRRAADI